MLHTPDFIPGHNKTSAVSLAALCTDALQSLADLTILATDHGVAQNPAADPSIEHQHERLVLWASNLGATHLGHDCLDYRLRHAELLRNTIKAFLNDLNGSLLECKEFMLHGELSQMNDVDMSGQDSYSDDAVDAAHQAMLEDDYGSESGGLDGQNFISLILESIVETIDALYRIAARVTSPETRTPTEKVLRVALRSGNSDVDMTRRYALLDEQHLREVFQNYRSVVHRSVSKEQGIPPQVLDPAQGEPLGFLALRLAQANTIRRKQFAYWSQHPQKLDVAPEAMARVTQIQQPRPQQASQDVTTLARSSYVADSVDPSPPTTATTLNPAQVDLEYATSVSRISDYVGSTRGVSVTRGEVLEFPNPPAKLKDCSEAICLFATTQEWIAHENSCHRRIWRCLEHPKATFLTVTAYKHHIREAHASNRTELESTELLRAAESVSEVADRPCPICLDHIPDAAALQDHLASHLRQIALFSLPRSTDADGGTESGTSWSGTAKGHHSDCSHDPSEITSGDSSSFLVQSSADIRTLKDERKEKTDGLSQHALRHLGTITPDRGPNAKVEQSLTHLDVPNLKNQSTTRGLSSAQNLAAVNQNMQLECRKFKRPFPALEGLDDSLLAGVKWSANAGWFTDEKPRGFNDTSTSTPSPREITTLSLGTPPEKKAKYTRSPKINQLLLPGSRW
ncbi:hypothetical protein FOPE_08556 [Fonsecaea pedrosoi]|nr:hypothetical protein FOPE_08556 [Fonsecaea pedrosoi]